MPRSVDTNGQLLGIEFMFTTPEYQQEAFNLVIEEANRVAADLNLSESNPITKSNVTHAFIVPFAHAYTERSIGNITTTNYWYFVKRDYKFTDLTIAKYDDYYVKYRDTKYQVPISNLDTNAAYQLAAKWLKAARMDVEGLNRDGELHVELSTDMLPGFSESAEKKNRRNITPVYYVWWTSKTNRLDNTSLASIELYLPRKQLLQLSVNDSQYVLRPRVTFTNLEALFPGKGEIITNYPSKPRIVDGARFGP